MAAYREQDAVRIIPLVSADGGITWYPKGGDPVKARPYDDAKRVRLKSLDAGVTWVQVP